MYVKGAKKAEQAVQTRRLLLDVARSLFAAHGYAGTSTEEVVQQASVTRGALYHHFRNKRALFAAVADDLERELSEHVIAAGAAESGLWEQQRAGIAAFLDACLDPAIHQILLLDGPSVLGWQAWRALDARYGLGILIAGLTALIEAGEIEQQPVEPLAGLLLGALTEGGLMIARAPDVQAARGEVGAGVDRLFMGLRAPPARP